LARRHERLDELHRLVMGTQLVGAAAAGDQQAVEVLRPDVFERSVDCGLHLALVTFDLRPCFQANDRDLVPRVTERVVGLLELGGFELWAENGCNLHRPPPEIDRRKPPYPSRRRLCGARPVCPTEPPSSCNLPRRYG